MLAQVYASLDDNDRAFYWLKQGCEHYRDQGSSDPISQWTKIDPGLAPLRSDPRFKDVLRCMGFSEKSCFGVSYSVMRAVNHGDAGAFIFEMSLP